ncbi:maltodextrin glucosidase [Vibrio cionasavignyae]|uniref:maltodextrin glucosidase n=1 Tax=Vibrio cionasavignyae TaxID=2910252 RepID=UPI003D0A5721
MSTPYLYHSQTTDGVTAHADCLHIELLTEDLPFERVLLRHEPDNEEYIIEMTSGEKKGRLRVWQAILPLSQDKSVTYYTFKAILGQAQYWLDGRGVQVRMPGREYHFKYNRVACPPEWVSEQVFYQIFPERFCNGDPSIGVEDGEYQYLGKNRQSVKRSWGEPVGQHGNTGAVEFYGGDLAGVQQKLDYLQALGITTLYLNPIFTSYSNHKYDTVDYYSIDPKFGTNQQFATLSEDIHQRGMKIVLDAVLNHTSTEHAWFDKSQTRNGAYGSVNSPYRDYYFFKDQSSECSDSASSYVGWKGIDTLPVLNFNNKQVRDAIYQSEDSVIKHWLKPPYLIDGWRFDVIHMLGEGEGAANNAHYVSAFREAMKSVSPDSYMLGEHFFEATSWLQGDQEDGSMNYYGFAHPVRALLASKDIQFDPIELDCRDFLEWLREASAKLPWANQLSQLNQLDSHDTERLLTTLQGDVDRFKIAAQLLMTYVGAPCLYYGTEVGLEGSHDPDNRRCFPWDRIEHSDWLKYFTELIAARRQLSALQKGSFVPLWVEAGGLIYAREFKGNVVISGFNLSDAPITVSLPLWKVASNCKGLRCWWTKTSYDIAGDTLKLEIKGKESILLFN